MSESGDVSSRVVKPLPGLGVDVPTMFAAKSRSIGLLVLTDPLLSAVLLPLPATNTSTGLLGSAPLYSKTLMSGYAAPTEKATATMFAPAFAALMFAE